MDYLPPVVRPTDPAGFVTPAAAADTGLGAGTPVICGTTDTVLEVFASGAVSPGQMTVKLATAGRICVITDRAWPSSPADQLFTYCGRPLVSRNCHKILRGLQPMVP